MRWTQLYFDLGNTAPNPGRASLLIIVYVIEFVENLLGFPAFSVFFYVNLCSLLGPTRPDEPDRERRMESGMVVSHPTFIKARITIVTT